VTRSSCWGTMLALISFRRRIALALKVATAAGFLGHRGQVVPADRSRGDSVSGAGATGPGSSKGEYVCKPRHVVEAGFSAT
jgi:hypothetical protein